MEGGGCSLRTTIQRERKKERGASQLSRPPPTVTGEDQKCVEIEMLGEARIQIAVQKKD